MARKIFPLLVVGTVRGDVFNKWAELIQIQSTLGYPRINLSGFSVPLMQGHQSWLCLSWFHFRSGGMPRLSAQYVLDCLPGASWGISPLHNHQQHCPFPTAPSQCVLMTKFYICLALYVCLSYPDYPTPSESGCV